MKTPSIQKATLLNELERKVEGHLQEAVRFQNMIDSDLLKPAASGGWSIAQCMDHLNSYGHYYLPQIRKGLDKQKGKPSSEIFTSSWFGNYFTRMMDPKTGTKKYKALKNYIPGVNLNAHAVIAEFIEQQETFLSYLNEAQHVDLNRVKIPLSIFKWITFKLGDAFQFLISHNERHVLQALRNLN